MRVSKIETHKIPELNETYCPCCGLGPLSGVTGASTDDEPVFPTDGSPSICCFCAELLVFRVSNDKLVLLRATEDLINTWKSEHSQAWNIMSSIQKEMKKTIESKKEKPKRF